jgi:alpha-galactosidase
MLVVLLAACADRAMAVAPTAPELATAKQFMAGKLLTEDTAALPFSFVYGGKPSAALLGAWKRSLKTEQLDAARTRRTIEYAEPQGGLQVRCQAIEYADFPVVEWTLWFRNTSRKDTPLLENVESLDTTWQRSPEGEFLLHHAIGSPAKRSDYAPCETPLPPKATKRLAGEGGRPTNADWAYFNLAWDRQGVIVAVGWPGQWAGEFVRDDARGLHLRAGQELLKTKLLPGEEIRSPLMAVLFWQGDYLRSQNLWRRWMMAHSMPRPGGKLPPPQFVASSSRAYKEMIEANEQNQIMHIDRYLAERLKLDYWWMDAGWYIQERGWPQVGTWEVDPKRFPRGLRPISDHAHSKGVKILLWFEPERVASGTWLWEHHPEWLLSATANKNRLLNLGNPAARQWLTDHVDRLLTEQGIDLYRQDFNINPLAFWHAADAADRQGITENKYVCGYLAYWDELRRRHPNMLIDSCASGGRRNDLETMRRAVPLWRSDYAYEPIGHQGMTYGISLWLPYHGTGTVASSAAPYYGGGFTPVEPYAFWSNAAPSLGSGIDVRVPEIDYAALRRLYGQWRQLSRFYDGDFYPLTPYSQDNREWIAWQFNAPERGEGAVQAFRRAENSSEQVRLKLRDLDPAATYSVTLFDTTGTNRLTGRELMQAGMPIRLTAKPAAAVAIYRRQK